MDNEISNSNKKVYKTSEKRLITCRKANRKYYEKNKERNSQKVLNRYYFKKEFNRLSNIEF